ncbi:uncharacterized protein LOC110250279 [Exaiptasia diaphana]|uniref:Uncharacterized protein n=1 Tax=Exaiptasia diaphana TaxID=2652724 RepID=A0A913XZ62_EXADI|nr:uncharacterized protein LOC110250279 [Exaiptasia diaphana]
MGQVFMKIKQMVGRLELSSKTESSLSRSLGTKELDEGLSTREKKILSKVLSKLELIEKVVESQSEVLGDQEAKLQTLEKTVQHAHDALQALKEPETTQELQCEPDKLVNDTPLVKMLDSIFSEESTNSDNKSIQPSALLQEHSQTLHEHEERLNTAMEKIQNVWDSLNKGPASSMVSMQQELAQLKSLLESLRQKHDALKTENNDELQLQQRLLDNLFSGFVVAFVLLVFICMFHK